MTQKTEKMVEVTAAKTIQAMKNGKPVMVLAGNSDSLPESEARAAEEAGLLAKPEKAKEESKPEKKKS